MTITDISAPVVTAQVSEADIGKVSLGQPATFTVTAYPDRTFDGTVTTIEPAGQTTSNVVTYNVLITPNAIDVELLPTMTATVTIITQEVTDAALVPNAALAYAESQGGSGRGGLATTSGGGTLASVYVLRNGAEVAVPVELDPTDGVRTVVLSGLQPGDQVVTGSAAGGNRQGSSGNIFGFGRPGAGGQGGARPGGSAGGGPPGGGSQGGARPGGGAAGGPPGGGNAPGGGGSRPPGG